MKLDIFRVFILTTYFKNKEYLPILPIVTTFTNTNHSQISTLTKKKKRRETGQQRLKRIGLFGGIKGCFCNFAFLAYIFLQVLALNKIISKLHD